MKNPSGSHFISIDSPRAPIAIWCDISVEAAGRLMAKYPHRAVAVKDLHDGITHACGVISDQSTVRLT